MTTYSIPPEFSGLETIATKTTALCCAVAPSGHPSISKMNLGCPSNLTLMGPSAAAINETEHKNRRPKTIEEAAKRAAGLCTAFWHQHAVEITVKPLSKKVRNTLGVEQ